MTAWLLTWNPKRTVLEEGWLAGESAKIRQGKNVSWTWSCGNTMSIAPGDRVFMLRQGREPRGVYGTGVVTRGSYRGAHWDGKRGHKAIYVRFKLDKLVDPEKYRTTVSLASCILLLGFARDFLSPHFADEGPTIVTTQRHPRHHLHASKQDSFSGNTLTQRLHDAPKNRES
jgi:hypothetical protein